MEFKAKDDWVFYNNLGSVGNEIYWTEVGVRAINYFDQVELLQPYDDNIGGYLYAMGKAELEKEKKLLSMYLGTDKLDWNEQNYKEIIEALNQILNIQVVYERVLKKVKAGNKESGKHEVVISSFFKDILDEELTRRLEVNFFRRKSFAEAVMNGDTSISRDFRLEIEKAIDSSIDIMIQRIAEQSDKEDATAWEEALAAVKMVDEFRHRFGHNIFERFGFQEMQRLIERSVREGIDAKALRDKVVANYRDKWSAKHGGMMKGRKLEGFIAEEVGQLFQQAALSAFGGNTKSFNIGAGAFTTDVMTIVDYSGVGTINIDERDIGSANNKRQAYTAIKTFYDVALNRLNNRMVIYENVKKKNMGRNFQNIYGGRRKLENLQPVLDHIGYTKGHAFINLIKQTADGALYGNTNKQQEAADALAAAVAFLLFDDLETIAAPIANSRTDIDALHIFRISDVVLPLSFLLIKMADTFNQANKEKMKDYVDISFKLPSLEYDYPQNDTSREASQARWEYQRNVMSDQAEVIVNFLGKFKDILKDFL